MPEESSVEVFPDTSPIWKEKEELSEAEIKALKGIRGMERLILLWAKSIPNVNFEELARKLYLEAFQPFGHSVREYRGTNTRVLGGKLKYPEYPLVPRMMKQFGLEVSKEFKETHLNPTLAEIAALTAKAHGMVYIHPFADGNGRVSRGLASYVLSSFGYAFPSWRFAGRDTYLDAVEKGTSDPKAFERFVTEALIASYRFRETEIQRPPYLVLSERQRSIRATIDLLQNHLGQIS